MAFRSLDLTLISAKDLKDVNLLGKMDVYAQASLSADPRSRQRTPIHVDSGPNPTWNHTVRFTIPADPPAASAALHILLRAEKKALGDKDLGEVHIPLRELLETVRGDGPTQPQFVSYQVRTVGSGKPKGVINLSYKLSERIAPQPPPTNAYINAYPPPTAEAPYPPPQPAGPPYPAHASYPPEIPPKNAEPATAYPLPSAYPAPAPSEKPAKSSDPVTAYPPSGYPAPAASEKPAKSSSDPVTAYPAASSSAAPYQPPPPYYGAPPPYGYAPPPQYGYAPPPQPGYGYPGYGYPPAQQAVQPQKKKKNGMGLGLGAGLIGGAIGGLILGDIVSDAAEDVYDSGYDAGFDDAGGFDF